MDKSARVVTVEKAVYQDKTNILFSGTLVTSGRAHGVVVAAAAQLRVDCLFSGGRAQQGGGKKKVSART